MRKQALKRYLKIALMDNTELTDELISVKAKLLTFEDDVDVQWLDVLKSHSKNIDEIRELLSRTYAELLNHRDRIIKLESKK